MYVETRILGRRARPLDGWSVPLPPGHEDGDGAGLTLRELIARVVRAEVGAFERRERARQLVRILSQNEMEQSAARGRVEMGGRSPGPAVDPDTAVAVALQGFQDGLYLVVLDGQEQRDLDRLVFPTPDSRLVFLRLTFLAGA